jgi:hypothetical protein
MFQVPCSPAATGLTIIEIDKIRMSGMPAKIERAKSWCAECPAEIKAACERQGVWYNAEGTRVILDGVFGGKSQAERS